MTRQRVPGRLLAWTTLVVALSASVGANVAEARPGIGERLTAGLAPVALIFASALLERVPFKTARQWLRVSAVAVLVFIVSATFITSFQHQYELLIRYGNEWLSAVLLPLAIDALILMASVSLTVIAERRRELLARPQQAQPEPEDGGEMTDTAADTAGQGEQPKRRRRELTTAERIERLYRRDPSVSPAVVARKVEVSERTAARHLSVLRLSDVDAELEASTLAEPVSAGG